jgi:DNA mismatch repair protein MSH6
MKGHVAHAGFPEISYASMAEKLVNAGCKVARVEQTETPEQLQERKKRTVGVKPKVVNREVCNILTSGTRTYCYLEQQDSLHEHSSGNNGSSTGPLLAVSEVLVGAAPDTDRDRESDAGIVDSVLPVCEYGVTLVDAVRGTVTVGQFADDVLRSRMNTLLTTFEPSEVRDVVCWGLYHLMFTHLRSCSCLGASL